MKFKTLERIENRLRLIDQTLLPQELVYKELDDYNDIIKAIKRLEVRGAPAIGVAAAYGMAVAAEQSGKPTIASMREIGDQFKASRPTAVNLFWAVDRVMTRLTQANPATDEITSFLWAEAEAIHAEDIELCQKIGKAGAELFCDGDNVLTHCNAGALATGGIGTALGVIYTCRDQGKNLKVFADETRPLLQGSRLTAWELMQEGIDVTLICDNMAGFLMAQGKIDRVIVGADRIAANGDTANKIGTYSVALLAREHRLPFYVAAPYSTFDEKIATGSDIVIEERAAIEVTEGFGRRTAPENIPVYSPAFDVTPNHLITSFITDQGVRPGGRSES